MRRSTERLLLLLLFCLTAAYAIAEELTLTTYYPSPRGVYEELRATGTVGIGTMNPGSPLHVEASGGGGPVTVTTHASPPRLVFQRSEGTTAAPTVLGVGNINGSLQFQGYDGSDYVTSAAIRSEVEGLPAAGDVPGRLVFLTDPAGAGINTERMRITSGGNVGIGTAVPDEVLDVNGAVKVRGAGIVNSGDLQMIEANQTDWLRIGNAAFTNGVAIYNNVATNGGLAVGTWTTPADGDITASGTITGDNVTATNNLEGGRLTVGAGGATFNGGIGTQDIAIGVGHELNAPKIFVGTLDITGSLVANARPAMIWGGSFEIFQNGTCKRGNPILPPGTCGCPPTFTQYRMAGPYSYVTWNNALNRAEPQNDAFLEGCYR